MIALFRLFLLVLLTSCVAADQAAVTASGGASNPNAPARWSLASFPKNVSVSSAFSDAEFAVIQSAASSWNGQVAGTNFFAISTTKITEKSDAANLDDLMDNVLGVYKGSTWSRELPSTALAVTQIFGVRQNRGQASEYVEIVEADILVNWTFPYKPTDITGYDLFSVVLHEYGHFLGLSHTTNLGHDSIMFPTIDKASSFTRPGSLDLSNLQVKYQISSRGALSAARPQAAQKPSTLDDVRNSGNGVRILLELYPDGTCLHRVDGMIVHTHPVKLQ